MKQNDLHFIGLTGGAGSGKSMVLEFFRKELGADVLEADRIAESLCSKDGECIGAIREAFPEKELYLSDGSMDRVAFARQVFQDENRRNQLNLIVHPAVKRYIIKYAEQKRAQKEGGTLVLEAALLLEEGYDHICDEIWYVYAPEEVRRRRLKETRGYPDEKIDQIFASQLPDSEFRRRSAAVIENSGTKEEVFSILKTLVEKRL